jgi:hypothetical protein
MTANQTTLGGTVWGLAMINSGGQHGNLFRISDGIDSNSAWDAGRPGLPINVVFYNPDPLLISALRFKPASTDFMLGWTFSGSTDGVTWTSIASGANSTTAITTIEFPAVGPFRYHRWQVLSTTDGAWLNHVETNMLGIVDLLADPIVTTFDGADKLYVALAPSDSSATTSAVSHAIFAPTSDGTSYVYKPHLPIFSQPKLWSHYNGTLYAITDAPEGAYALKTMDYEGLLQGLAQGGTLGWDESTQRPWTGKWLPWTQIVATADEDPSGAIFPASSYGSGELPYKAMDGISSGSSATSFWGSYNETSAWWKVQFPYPLRISALRHYNRYNSTYAAITGRYWADTAMEVPLGDAFTLTGSWASLDVFSTDSPIETDTIYFQKTNGNPYSGIGEIVITATHYEIFYEVKP